MADMKHEVRLRKFRIFKVGFREQELSLKNEKGCAV